MESDNSLMISYLQGLSQNVDSSFNKYIFWNNLLGTILKILLGILIIVFFFIFLLFSTWSSTPTELRILNVKYVFLLIFVSVLIITLIIGLYFKLYSVFTNKLEIGDKLRIYYDLLADKDYYEALQVAQDINTSSINQKGLPVYLARIISKIYICECSGKKNCIIEKNDILHLIAQFEMFGIKFPYLQIVKARIYDLCEDYINAIEEYKKYLVFFPEEEYIFERMSQLIEYNSKEVKNEET